MNIFDYKWWWSKIGGRPWTFISRDIWHQFEYIAIMALLFAGWIVGYNWQDILNWIPQHPIVSLGVLFGLSTFWYILGHFFYGKKYIPFQRGK